MTGADIEIRSASVVGVASNWTCPLIDEALPAKVAATLERRYLSDFSPAMWDIAATPEDAARPLLRQFTAIGRPASGEDWGWAIPHALTAADTPGQALVSIIYGDGARQHIYVGARRLVAGAEHSTDSYLDGQELILRAHIHGLELGPVLRLDGQDLPDLMAFLGEAPALGVLTGIPSQRGGRESRQFQTLDRLMNAVGDRRYAIVTVAEPLEPAIVDDTLELCRRLKGEIHSLVKQSISQSSGETSSTTGPDSGAEKATLSSAPLALAGLAAFCDIAGLFLPAVGVLGKAGALAMTAGQAGLSGAQFMNTSLVRSELRHNHQVSSGTSTTKTGTIEMLDVTAEACEMLLQRHIDRLSVSRSQGWWRTSVYIATEGEASLGSVSGALRGMASGDSTGLDPLRLVRPPAHQVRSALIRGQSLKLVPAVYEVRHPLGGVYDSFGTCMTSDELAVLLSLPRVEVPGIPMRDVGDFALSPAPPEMSGVEIGDVQNSVGRTLGPVSLSGAALNRHVFITGMTGYGKTTTSMRLIVEAYRNLGVPFLVIEPAKAEYRQLAELPQLRNRLRIYGIGNDSSTPLRLNPFVPVSSVPLSRHIDLVKAVFNASFPMFAGMSYVLEDAMLKVYEDRGWNLYASSNDILGPRPSRDDFSTLVPSLADLLDAVEVVLSERNYASEVHQNMGAALRSRLRSLMVGTKGMTLNTTRSLHADDLFTGPAVVELRNLGDDEEKSFVMALLLVLLYEYAESRQKNVLAEGQLQHLTLVEEAHRLLRAPRSESSPESPDAQAKAVTMFTDMLAEMRAYGEGFIVADQVPTKLAPDILKNSSVKILHRLVAPDDRRAAGGTINLTEPQMRQLANLPPGVAVVHDEGIGAPVLMRARRVDADADLHGASAGAAAPTSDRTYLHRNGACRACPSPCDFAEISLGRTSGLSHGCELADFMTALCLGSIAEAWDTWSEWRSSWLECHSGRGWDERTRSGAMYCSASQAAFQWLASLSKDVAANSAVGPSALRADRAARAVGVLISAWQHSGELDGPAKEAFSRAQDALAKAHAMPPAEVPGCAECPARCRALPVVSQHMSALRQTIAERASTSTSVGTRILSLQRALEATHINWDALPEAKRESLIYCFIANAAPDRHDRTLDLLRALRSVPTT